MERSGWASSGGSRSSAQNHLIDRVPLARALAAGSDPLIQTEYRELTRKHLGSLTDDLFAEFTGLHFHIAWAPSLPHDWTAETLPTGCSVCCRLAGTSVDSQANCRTCGPRQLARALSADGEGHLFTCRLGLRNYWFPIRLRGVTVGTAYVQALAGPKAARCGRLLLRRKRVGAQVPRASSEARHLDRAAFSQAAKLLRFIVQHAQTSCLADLGQADLTRARQALLDFETVQARLRQELSLLTPVFHKTADKPAAAGHAEQVMRRLLDRIHQHYAQPLTLQQCAAALGLNAAYLSDLFSRMVGMPFKAYLTEVRMERAKQLLSDPTKNVSEAAFAVGYASENRFRVAFKKATGLPPRIWREAVRLP